MIVERMDLSYRIAEKQASRDEDARMLRDGEITHQELRKRNHILGGVDMSSFRIVAIGGKPIRSLR